MPSAKWQYLITVEENNVYAEAYAQWEPTFSGQDAEAIDAATQQANRLTETEGMDEPLPWSPPRPPAIRRV